MELLYDPALALLITYLKKSETLIQKNISTPVFIARLFTITKMWKQPKDIYTMDIYYSATKKEKISPFVTIWIELENIMLSEISQSEKDKSHKISLICGT